MLSQNTVVIVVVIGGAIGAALIFVGLLASLVTAVGNKHWPWVAGMLLFFPVAIPYSLVHREEAGWPRKLLLRGLALAAVAGCFFLLFDPSLK